MLADDPSALLVEMTYAEFVEAVARAADDVVPDPEPEAPPPPPEPSEAEKAAAAAAAAASKSPAKKRRKINDKTAERLQRKLKMVTNSAGSVNDGGARH